MESYLRQRIESEDIDLDMGMHFHARKIAIAKLGSTPEDP